MASQLVARAAATSGAAVAAAGYAYFRELASEDDAPSGSSEGPTAPHPASAAATKGDDADDANDANDDEAASEAP